MELFEELDFKPMTEGLGFHRNAPTSNTPSSQAQAAPNPNRTSTPQTPAAKASHPMGASSVNPAANPPTKPNLAKAPPPPTFKATTSPEVPKTKLPAKPPFVPALKPEYSFLDEESLTETKKFAQELNQPKNVPDRTKIYEPIGRKDYSSPQLAKSSDLAKSPSFGIPVPGAPASLSALRNQSAPTAPAAVQTKVTAQKVNVSTASTLNLTPAKERALSTNIPSAILDGVFAFGVSLVLLVGVLLMTKADLVALLSNSQTDRFVQFQLGVLFLMVLQMYMLVSRTLFDQTIGEWTYEIQLGTYEQKTKAIYPVQVVWRGILFAITGFVLIPILSKLFDQDLATPITGLALHKKQNAAK